MLCYEIEYLVKQLLQFVSIRRDFVVEYLVQGIVNERHHTMQLHETNLIAKQLGLDIGTDYTVSVSSILEAMGLEVKHLDKIQNILERIFAVIERDLKFDIVYEVAYHKPLLVLKDKGNIYEIRYNELVDYNKIRRTYVI